MRQRRALLRGLFLIVFLDRRTSGSTCQAGAHRMQQIRSFVPPKLRGELPRVAKLRAVVAATVAPDPKKSMRMNAKAWD